MTDIAPLITHQTTQVVRTVGLGKWINDRPILQEVDLNIEAGGYVALLGANGAGKSTLLQILATLIPPTQGKLHLFGQLLTRSAADLRARIGMIGHQAMLYRDLSAWENLVFFGKLYGLRDPQERASQVLEWVGLSDRGGDPVKAFSRGMIQRTAIARALMHDPDLLLADEPFAGLDVPSSHALEDLLEGLHKQGKTVVLVNHDIAQSLRLSQRTVVLRQGRIVVDIDSRSIDAATVLHEVSQP